MCLIEQADWTAIHFQHILYELLRNLIDCTVFVHAVDAAKALSAAELASLRNYTITRLGLATWQRPQVLCSLTQEDVTSSPGDHFVSTEIGNVFKKKVLEHKTTATVCINYFLCVCTLPETGVHLSII